MEILKSTSDLLVHESDAQQRDTKSSLNQEGGIVIIFKYCLQYFVSGCIIYLNYDACVRLYV